VSLYQVLVATTPRIQVSVTVDVRERMTVSAINRSTAEFNACIPSPTLTLSDDDDVGGRFCRKVIQMYNIQN
jgi:hypothetical protein